MNRNYPDTDSPNDYFAPIKERLQELHTSKNLCTQALFLLKSSEVHFDRYNSAQKRLRRAITTHDQVGIKYETELILILLYEIADNIFQIVALLDLDQLPLAASMDGLGLAGESAAEVVITFSSLDQQCSRLLEIERCHSLNLDFRKYLDEREGLSYEAHKHWQDFVPNSVADSFYAYFALAQATVRERLSQKPRFWNEQIIGQYLNRKGYQNLNEVLSRLEKAHFTSMY